MVEKIINLNSFCFRKILNGNIRSKCIRGFEGYCKKRIIAGYCGHNSFCESLSDYEELTCNECQDLEKCKNESEVF